MRGGKTWNEAETAKALELDSGGLSYAEIGRALDRSPRAVECALRKRAERKNLSWHPYLRDLNGPPIGTDDETISFKRNAVRGSTRLLTEIQRVFG